MTSALARRIGARVMSRGVRRLLAVALFCGAPSALAAQYPPVVTRSRLDPDAGVNFHAILLADTVFVGQQATYQIGVFLNQETRRRLRRNPEFVPPETRSLLVYDLPDAKAPLIGTIDGRAYEVHVFQRAFFALSPGTYVIPPSQLTYALPQTSSFFSREDMHSLRSESRTLVVRPVPLAGRPASWSGAVGEWRAQLRVDSTRAKVGNPIVVTLKVGGLGNVALLPRPAFTVPWGTVVPSGERVMLDSTPTTLRGAKEFDWLVTPHAAGTVRVPVPEFSYFDPLGKRFEVAAAVPVTVQVEEGEGVTVDSLATPPGATQATIPSRVPALALHADPGRASARSWFGRLWYFLLLGMAPVPALAIMWLRRPRRRARAHTAGERLVAAPPRDVTALRRLMHEAVHDRCAGLDAGLLLARGELVTALRHEGVTLDTAQRANALLRALDAAAFGRSGAYIAPDDILALYRDIDREARGGTARRVRRGAARAAGSIALLLAVLAPAVAWGRQGDAMRTFQRAREAYASAEYAMAQRLFLDLARAEPRNAVYWSNAGTASWMAADTARAVQGWQRALRLAPLDTELRDRLALTRAAQERGPARVPPVPGPFAAAFVLLAWLAVWSWLAWRAWRRAPVVRWSLVAVVCGAAALAGVAALDAITTGRDRVVVARPEPLRALPVLGGERGVAPLVGEVGIVVARKGAWAHVRLDGQRDGWIAAEFLLPLGD